jgi:hypothetical protein
MRLVAVMFAFALSGCGPETVAEELATALVECSGPDAAAFDENGIRVTINRFRSGLSTGLSADIGLRPVGSTVFSVVDAETFSDADNAFSASGTMDFGEGGRVLQVSVQIVRLPDEGAFTGTFRAIANGQTTECELAEGRLP